MKPRWSVTYKAQSDGRIIEIGCASKKEAEEFKKMVEILDTNSEAQVHQR